MSAAEHQLYELLKGYGFELERNSKHRVYKNPLGVSWTLPSSPSDERWAENNLHDLKNLLGIGNRGKEAVIGERREKRSHHKENRPFLSSLTEFCQNGHNATFQQKLAVIIPTLFSGAHDETSGKPALPLSPDLEALKERLSEMIFGGMTMKQIAEHAGGVDEALVRIVVSRLFGKGIREIRKQLQPVKPITTKELDYGKLELLIRAGYSLEKVAKKIDYSPTRLTALCKKYWDKTPQELRFEWADSTYEMLRKANGGEAAPVAPVPTPPTSSVPPTAAAAIATANPQFAEKDYPCARCNRMIHVSAEQQREMRIKYGDRATLRKLCFTCKSLMDGKFQRIVPSQLQEGDEVLQCQGCGNKILFTRKQQDEFTVKDWPEPKFCRKCRTRSGGSHKAHGLAHIADIEAHFMSQEEVQ